MTGKGVLRHWLKSSLHTTPGVHESSIGTKLGRASSRPRCSSPPPSSCCISASSLLRSSRCHHRLRSSPRKPGFTSPRRNYGNTVSLAKDLRGAEKLRCRCWKYQSSSAFAPLLASHRSSLGSSILLYWTCRIKSRTKHRTPRRKRAFEIIPGEIGSITVGVPLQIFRLATDRGPVELGIAPRDPCFLRISNLLSLDRQMEWDPRVFRAADRRVSFVRPAAEGTIGIR